MEKRKVTVLKIGMLPLLAIFVTGCFYNVKTTPQTPLEIAKAEFINNYEFFITPEEEKIGYPKLEPPIKPFDKIDSETELDRFIEHFWKIRDPDPNTPENEFKELIDSRIQDIKNEIFLNDPDIAGISFERNGGLKGDMAHVYLLDGMPHFKARLSEGRTYVEMMVWYYFDPNGHPLFRFLFYNNYGTLKLLKPFFGVNSADYLFDPSVSPLKEISNRPITSPEDVVDLWDELSNNDTDGTFRTPIFEFSYYTDITMDRALGIPEPSELTAQRLKSRILGQPEDLTGRDVVLSKYHSFLPLYVRIIKTPDGNPSIYLNILESSLDWEIKNGKAESVILFRLDLNNKTTGEVSEFFIYIKMSLDKEKLGDQSRSIPILIDNLPGKANGELSPIKFSDFAKKLSPGEYTVSGYIVNLLTNKNNAISTQTFIK